MAKAKKKSVSRKGAKAQEERAAIRDLARWAVARRIAQAAEHTRLWGKRRRAPGRVRLSVNKKELAEGRHFEVDYKKGLIRLFSTLLLCAFCVLNSGCQKTEQQKMFEIARESVRQSLKAPSTAKFCPMREAHFGEHEGKPQVELWVDAQNAFGVPLRSNWGVTFEPGTHRVTKVICFEQELARIKAEHDEKMRQLEASTRDIVRRSKRP